MYWQGKQPHWPFANDLVGVTLPEQHGNMSLGLVLTSAFPAASLWEEPLFSGGGEGVLQIRRFSAD